MKLVYVYLLAVAAPWLFSCEDATQTGVSTDAASVLEATRSKMLNTPTHHYRFRSFWDNRFASSTYKDSMRITYSSLPGGDLGFGFKTSGGERDILYDGKELLKIDHTKRKVIRTTAEEIAKDSTYFANYICFKHDPKVLPLTDNTDRVTDTIVGGKQLFYYALTTYTPSTDDPDKDVVSTREYYLDPVQNLVDRIRNVTHIENDTIQVIDYFFSDYVFSEEPYLFGDADRKESLAYRELSKAADKLERKSGLIRPGAQLHRADYTDINNKEQLIYGKAGKKTMVMFSFIGCGGCEYALREMKKKDFAVRDGLDLVYSSVQDDAAALKTYFKKKEFPFVGFGGESQMNENFKVAGFPTFVLISEDGGVERVMGGYDEEVADVLFK